MNEDQESKVSLESSLEALLEDPGSKWKLSDSGAGGSILARNENGEGVAVKIEDFGSTNQAAKLGKMMGNFYAEAKGEQPFEAPRTMVFQAGEMNENLAQRFETKLNDLSGDYRLDKAKANFGEAQKKPAENALVADSQTVLVQEFAKGTQLNHLSTEQKMAMMNDPEFGQQLGKALPVVSAMGLGDHFGVSESRAQNNPSNFMYEPESKTLSVIDYATQVYAHGPRVEISDVLTDLSKIENTAKLAAKSPESFRKLAEDSVTDSNRAYCPTLDPYISNGGSPDNFLTKDEANQITPEMRVEFALNFIEGTVEGLDYLSQNKEALISAAKKMHEEVNGETIEHFYSSEKIDQMGAKLDQIKAEMPTIKAGIACARTGLEVNELQTQANDLKTQANDIQSTIERKTGGPVNAIKNRMNPERVGELKTQLEAVNQQLEAVNQQLGVANQKLEVEVKKANQLMLASENANKVDAPDAPLLSNGEVLQNGQGTEPELGPNIGNEAGDQSRSPGAVDAREVTQSVSVKTIKDKFEAGNEGTKVSAPAGTNRSLT